MKTEELFLSDNSIAYNYIIKYEYPYLVLPHIEEIILNIGKNLNAEFEEVQENVWIHKNAKVSETAYIKGPCIIDDGAEIRHNAFIRGKAIIGKHSVLGNSSEIKNAILFDNVETPHFNYIGDSILGYKSHMSAGCIASNLRSDRQNIVIKYNNETIETGMRKIGTFLGDYVEVGCNSVLNPASFVGPNTNIYPLTSVRGVIPKNSIVKNMQEIISKEER